MADRDKAKQKIIRMETGERIRREREAVGMSRRQLAEIIGVSEKTVVSIETGTHGTTIYRMIEISDVLNTSLDYLLKGSRDTITKAEEEYLAGKTEELFDKVPPEQHKVVLEFMETMFLFIRRFKDI